MWVRGQNKLCSPSFVEAECKAEVAHEETQCFVLRDNLDAQKQPEYINYLKEFGFDAGKLPRDQTDQ
ncbi:MAG: hypothetical protein SGPRY_011270, partial [Prymnesium sp.]